MVSRIAISIMLSSAAMLAQPVVTGALNAAGYMRAGLPNGGLAQGSFIAIFGTNIGPAAAGGVIPISGYPLQTTFNGVSATLGGKPLFIVYTSPTQAGAIVPSDTPLGNQPLILNYNGQSAPFTVQVVRRAFGMFTLNQAGSGPVVGLKFISQSSQPPSTLLEAMNPGGTITLFGTGLGASANPDNQAATNPTVTGLNPSDVEVLIGGKPAPIQFVGRSSCCSAIDQIVADIPADVTPGCYVSLIVRVAGVTSNSTTIAVAPQGKSVCSDPNGYSEEQLQKAMAQGSFSAGYLQMAKLSTEAAGLGTFVTDSGSAVFQRYDLNQLVRSQGGTGFTSIGSCSVYSFSGQDSANVDPIRPTGLDAGNPITLNNSLGTQTLERVAQAPGVYSKTASSGSGLPSIPPGTPGFGPEFLTTGNHTYTAPGGAQVGAFTANLNWPAAFVWTNKAAITAVPRSSNLTVTWSGGDPEGSVYILGTSATGSGNNIVGGGFFCTAPANAQSFSVPSAILSALPASATIGGNTTGSLAVYGVSKTGTFTASGLDYGIISYQAGSAKSVGYN